MGGECAQFSLQGCPGPLPLLMHLSRDVDRPPQELLQQRDPIRIGKVQ